jgi:peptide/nickel transport system substrate-binding protein
MATSMLAAPRIGKAAGADVLKFIPQAELGAFDPIWSVQAVTRNHGYVVFDTLYGTDSQERIRPQMVEGHRIDNDGLVWTITLRDGLTFHDGTPVLARDCVASIQRWAKRDGFGATLMARTAELSAPSDKVIRFRLNRPFALLPNALGKLSTAVIMPERLAKTDAFTRVNEVIGSGPFRFMAQETVSGAFYAYERFDGYVPRNEPPSYTAGGKNVYIPRVEWHVTVDDSTAFSALQNGEMDWWERVSADLGPMMQRNKDIVTQIMDPSGQMCMLRPNHLHPPFDNPDIRRALLGVIDQRSYMQAAAGTDPAMWRDKVGFFCPLSPLANDAGMDILTGPRDIDKARREIEKAGYKGEKVVNLTAADHTDTNALGEMSADILRKVGFNVYDLVADSGSMSGRRINRETVDKGGWSTYCTTYPGTECFDPAAHLSLRANGKNAQAGWPTSPTLERLRDEWFDAPDPAAQKNVARKIQLQAFQDVPYYPLGQSFRWTSFRKTLTGIAQGFPMFWGIRKTV